MNRGKIICFFGIDGAGKTTTIGEIKKKLEEKEIPNETIYMGRAGNHKIPIIKLFMKLRSIYFTRKRKIKKNKESGPIVDIYRQRSVIWLVGYYIELWIRYLEALIKSRNRVILMDRYFYDGLVLSKKNISLFKYLTPKPYRSFFLYAPAELIMKRKKEAGKKDIEEYYSEVEKFREFFEIIKIDNSQELSKTVERIYGEIARKKT